MKESFHPAKDCELLYCEHGVGDDLELNGQLVLRLMHQSICVRKHRERKWWDYALAFKRDCINHTKADNIRDCSDSIVEKYAEPNDDYKSCIDQRQERINSYEMELVEWKHSELFIEPAMLINEVFEDVR
jgi:hypothetical protein